MINEEEENKIKEEVKKYINNIEIPNNLEGIVMEDINKVKKKEKRKMSKKAKILAGVASFIVVAGVVSAVVLKDNNIVAEDGNSIQTPKAIKEDESKITLGDYNINIEDKDLYAVGFDDIAFIENGEVYYGYKNLLSEDSTDVGINIKKIEGIKDAISIGAYNLSTDVTKTFYIITESGILYSLSHGKDCEAVRAFKDYEIKSIISAQGEGNQEFIFILKDNEKIKINTYMEEKDDTVEKLGVYSNVNIIGNKGNVQKGTNLYDCGFESASFLINGNAYFCKPNRNSSGEITLTVNKIKNLSNIKNVKGLSIGNDPTMTYFAVKENGEVYDYCNAEELNRTEIMKNYNVENIISSIDNGYDENGMDVYEIKIKLKDGSTVSVYTGNNVKNDIDKGITKVLADNTKDIVYSYIDQKVIDTASKPSGTHIYQIPKVNLNSEYAIEINNQIKSKFEEVYQLQMQSKKDNLSIEGNILYKYYINNNILSLVVANFTGMNDYVEYVIYNINLTNGQKANEIELLNSIGLEETEYNKLLDNAKKKLYNDHVYSINQIGMFIKDNKIMVILDPTSNLVDLIAEIIDLNSQTKIDAYNLFNFQY